MFGKTEALFTEAILSALHALEEAPWKDLNGKGLDSRGLALRLRQYGIKSKQIRDGTTNKKGYQRADLADAWARYLPSPQTSETSETAETTQHFQGPIRMFRIALRVSDEAPNVSDSPPDVSLNGGPKNPTKSTSVSDVSDVSLLADHERRTSEAVNGARSGLHAMRPSWRQRSLLQRRADGPAAPRMRGALSASPGWQRGTAMTAEAARMSRRLPTLVRRRDSPASSTRSYAPTTMNAEGPLMDSRWDLVRLTLCLCW